MVNSQNINLAICIQVTFISENKLQEKILFRKSFFGDSCVQFESLLAWKCACVCDNLGTEKEAIYVKKWECKRRNSLKNDLSFGNLTSRATFLANYHYFFRYWFVHFELLLEWEFAYACHNLRTENFKKISKKFKINLQKYIYYQNMTLFSAVNTSFLNPC